MLTTIAAVVRTVRRLVRARMFSRSERLLLMTACINHGSDIRRTGNDPEPSFALARELAPQGWIDSTNKALTGSGGEGRDA